MMAPPTPVEDVSTPLGHALMVLESAYSDLRASIASDLGISVLELTAMDAVASSPQYTPKMLGIKLSITTGSVTALVDRLDRAGYLARVPNPQDRRSVFLTVTAQGGDLLREAARRHDAAVEEMRQVSPHLADPDIVEDMIRAAAVLAAHTIG